MWQPKAGVCSIPKRPLQRIENEDELVNGAIGRILRPAQGPVSYYIMLRQTLRRILVRHQGINPFPAQTAKDRGEFPLPAGNSDRRPNPTQPFEIDTDHPTSSGSFDFPAVRIIEAKTNISDRLVLNKRHAARFCWRAGAVGRNLLPPRLCGWATTRQCSAIRLIIRSTLSSPSVGDHVVTTASSLLDLLFFAGFSPAASAKFCFAPKKGLTK
jgi:hypothetical protein